MVTYLPTYLPAYEQDMEFFYGKVENLMYDMMTL